MRGLLLIVRRATAKPALQRHASSSPSPSPCHLCIDEPMDRVSEETEYEEKKTKKNNNKTKEAETPFKMTSQEINPVPSSLPAPSESYLQLHATTAPPRPPLPRPHLVDTPPQSPSAEKMQASAQKIQASSKGRSAVLTTEEFCMPEGAGCIQKYIKCIKCIKRIKPRSRTQAEIEQHKQSRG